MSIDISKITNTVSAAMQTQQTRLDNTLSNLEARGSEGVSQTEILQLQRQMGLVNMFVELQSTMVKAFMDSVKSVIQKSS